MLGGRARSGCGRFGAGLRLCRDQRQSRHFVRLAWCSVLVESLKWLAHWEQCGVGLLLDAISTVAQRLRLGGQSRLCRWICEPGSCCDL